MTLGGASFSMGGMNGNGGIDGLGLVENKKAPHRLMAMRGMGIKSNYMEGAADVLC